MPRKHEGKIYTPKESFVASVDGIDTALVRNRDYVREGHELLRRFPDMFEEMRVTYEVEQATAAPGERR
jgi:hypothetical protein